MITTALLIYLAISVIILNVALLACLMLDRDPVWSATARVVLGWPALAVAVSFAAVQLVFDAVRGTFKFVMAKLSRK